MKSLFAKLGVILIGLAIFGYGYTEVWGADWKFLLKNDAGEYFYDAEGITHPSENIFGVWLKIIYSQKGIDEKAAKYGQEYKKLGETLILWEINCPGKRCCIVCFHDCSKSGDVIRSLSNSEREWNFIAPGTITAIFHKMICK
jgi:hypothetical protein